MQRSEARLPAGPLPASDDTSAVLETIRARAAAADRGEVTLANDLAMLHQSGLLAELVSHTSVGGDAAAGVRLLRAIGRASLPVGRIVEGHANALRLIQLYGTVAQIAEARALCHRGCVFGVWGADGREPVTITASEGDQAVLAGVKMFCSGLGLVSRAVIPVKSEAGPVLLIARVDDPARADVSAWNVSGMKATASGRYALTGLAAERLGRPGDFEREPHFEGGIWRYCALQCGGLEALADEVRRHVLSWEQDEDAQQCERVARMVILAHTARLWVEASSSAVEGVALSAGAGVTAAVTQALLARQAVETACLEGIALTERTMGTAAFSGRSDADRIRRDLAFFLRQANLDGKLAKASRALLADPAAMGGTG